MIHPTVTIYSLITVVAMVVSFLVWSRLWKRDPRLMAVYFGALFGALIGAKVAYLAAEGWLAWDSPFRWQQWVTGKSIVGALLGGYLGVELAKRFVGYTQATGDGFALVVPLAIAFGRIGCLLQGCCLGKACTPAWWTIMDTHGVARWPAVPVEMGFNLLVAAVFWSLWGRTWACGQLFHLYLMAYGLFRVVHEPWRDTPRLAAHLTGYQVGSFLLFLLGLAGFLLRARKAGGAGFAFAPVSGRANPR